MSLLPKDRPHGWAPYVWLIFLSFFLLQPILNHGDGKEWLLTVAAVAVFLLLYFGIFWIKAPWNYLMLAGMVAIGVGLGRHNPGSSVFIIYTASFLPWIFQTPKTALAALGGLIAILAIDAVMFNAPLSFWATSMIVALGVGGSNIHFAEKNRANEKLRMAHTEIEHLAKVAERERIARDLHDVLGHTLSVIIVKSTLAGKLLEKNSPQAREEIRDIEKVSREAMAEIRNTLRGYSTYRVCDELQRAQSVLESAGVALESEATEVPMTAAEESVVALIMREAVTNVVRHAQAQRCRLRLQPQNGNCVLQIEDDGRGGFQFEGNGMRGMRERIEALGGTLARDTSVGTKLKFEFPLTANGKH